MNMINEILNDIKGFASYNSYTKIADDMDKALKTDDLVEKKLFIKKALTDITRDLLNGVTTIPEGLDVKTLEVEFKKLMDGVDGTQEYRNQLNAYLKTLLSIKMNDVNGKADGKKNTELAKATIDKLKVYDGETNRIIDLDSEDVKDNKSKFKKFMEKNGKTIMWSTGVAVVTAAIILACTYCQKPSDVKTNENDNDNKPTTTDEDGYTSHGNGGIMRTDEDDADTVIIDEPVMRDLDAAVNETYEIWSKITTKYSKEVIAEVIKALNGMDSSLSFDAADSIVTDVIGEAVKPKMDYLFLGKSFTPKTVSLKSLVLDQKTYGLYDYGVCGTAEEILNGAIKDGDYKRHVDRAIICTTDWTNDGTIYAATPIEQLLFARLGIQMNVISGTLGENYSVECNGNVYSLKDVNSSNVYEDIVTNARNEIIGIIK